jgi:hypothetical protein
MWAAVSLVLLIVLLIVIDWQPLPQITRMAADAVRHAGVTTKNANHTKADRRTATSNFEL